MRSRINSTNRQKIDPSMVSFAVTERPDETAEVQASIDLSALRLSGQAEVIVEAYRQNLHERFSFGTVQEISPTRTIQLRELGKDGLKFRVKVVEPETGRLLARGDRLGSGDAEAGRRELLKVIVRDLGEEPWKTEFDDNNEPVLVLNEQIPDALPKIKTDPLFQGLILPAALRQILLMLWRDKSEEADDDEDDESHWTTQWLRYARALTGREKPEWEEEDAVWSWIDGVCKAFSNEFHVVSRMAPNA